MERRPLRRVVHQRHIPRPKLNRLQRKLQLLFARQPRQYFHFKLPETPPFLKHQPRHQPHHQQQCDDEPNH